MRSTQRWRKAVAAALVAVIPLAGCSSGSALLEGDTPAVGSAGTPLANVGAKPVARTISFRPPSGPPDEVNSELTKHLNDAAIEHGIALISDTNIKADYSMRGYMSALKKGSAVNVSYLWDVLDARGQRVGRIEGEEALSGVVDLKAPWTAVNPAVSKVIAQRSMSELATWVKSQKAGGVPTAAAPQSTTPQARSGLAAAQ